MPCSGCSVLHGLNPNLEKFAKTMRVWRKVRRSMSNNNSRKSCFHLLSHLAYQYEDVTSESHKTAASIEHVLMLALLASFFIKNMSL